MTTMREIFGDPEPAPRCDMAIDPTRAWIAPCIADDRYCMRYDGRDYLVHMATLAKALFRDWA